MLVSILFDVAFVVLVLTILGVAVFIGREGLETFRDRPLEQLRTALPYLLLVGGVLLINDYLRDVGPEISWVIGWDITNDIISLEGSFIADLQEYQHSWLTVYFSYIYIYGYIFLLVFPIVAYILYTDDRPIKEAAIAYALNYGIGVICYLIFIAWGPRNVGYGEGLLYTHWPEAQILTSEVNANVNVFPSLHTSLAATVALLAIRWRDIYWRWLPVAIVLAISVAISTMYLGIHWATDVVAGLVLAVGSVWAAIWLADPERQASRLGALGRALRRPIDRRFDYFVLQAKQRNWFTDTEIRRRTATYPTENKIVCSLLVVWGLIYLVVGGSLAGVWDPGAIVPAPDAESMLGLTVGQIGYLIIATGLVIIGLAYGIRQTTHWAWWGVVVLTSLQTGLLIVLWFTGSVAQIYPQLAAIITIWSGFSLWDQRRRFSVRLRTAGSQTQPANQ